MSDCPNCGQRLEMLAWQPNGDYHLCRRCGTVCWITHNAEPGQIFNTYTPQLVERCRKFERKTVGVGSLDEDQIQGNWRDIYEAIHKPEDRK